MEGDEPVIDALDPQASLEPPAPEGVLADPLAGEDPPAPAVEKPPFQAPKWAMDRIHEETNKRQEAATRAAEIEKENRTLKEVLARLQKGETLPAAPREAPSSDPAPDPNRYAQDVKAEASRQRMYEDTLAVRNMGMTAFPDFAESLGILTALGATTDDFVSDILATSGTKDAHVLIDKLAKDPERTANLAKLDSRSRIAQLTRMSMPEQQPNPPPKTGIEPPKPKPLGKGPPPPPPRLDPAGAPGDPTDLMDEGISDDEFYRRWKAKRKIA